jgi:hypothetical protein
MTVWEKTLTNLQKGYDKLTSFAAIFADRVRAEITIVRLKIQIERMREKISEQQHVIGKTLLQLRENKDLPRTVELFFQNDEIAAAVEKIERYQRDRAILLDDLQRESEVLKPASASHEEKSA